tara:strand:+ start:472 stop:2094 length:1623 start_codon:yes stop_codon:yes gene_type:complete
MLLTKNYFKMRKIIYLLLVSFYIVGCSKKAEVLQIPLTSSSEEAIKIFATEVLNSTEGNQLLNQNNEQMTKALNKALELDPDFLIANAIKSLYFRQGMSSEKRNELITTAYENKSRVSEVEGAIIASIYEQIMSGNLIKAGAILEESLQKFPNYSYLWLYTGYFQNTVLLNPKKSEYSWEKALEINPESARAKVLLSQLHFVTGQINTLSKNEIDEAKSISLIEDAEKTDSKNYLYSRLLGNIYRARSEFDKSLSAYKKAQTLISDKNSFEYSLLDLLSGHNYLFKKDFNKARELYLKSNNSFDEASFPNVLTKTWTAHTYLYEKKYDEAIEVINVLENQINSLDNPDPMRKINALATCDWERFLTYGHSQMKEDAYESVINRNVHLDELKEKRKASAGSKEEVLRISLATEIEKDFLKIWYLILFGEFEDAFSELKSYSQLSSEYLVYDSKAMVNFYKLSGYLNLMSGNLDASISFYNQIPKELLDADNYHLYFYALATKSKGQKEKSDELFKYLANYNFAGWENSIIRALAQVQLYEV